MKNNNIRKLLAGVLAVIMCLALAACGSTAETPAAATAAPTAEAAADTAGHSPITFFYNLLKFTINTKY